MSESIFVQIASYRDPELVPTIRDCIAKAAHPENLSFGVCWQKDETESMEEFFDDSRFKIVTVPWNESRGLCWARSLIQKFYGGEKYTLQLDSHHRFVQNWDTQLIEMMALTGSPKPIITAYAGIYTPASVNLTGAEPGVEQIVCSEPYKMVPDKFTDTGTIMFYPQIIHGWRDLVKPIPARFVSGHFFFTWGQHCIDYKYDPNLYFAGDEISLSIRSFTLGYDLFHPHRVVIYHEYSRQGRRKHWDDFTKENVEKHVVHSTWPEMDAASKKRLRHMLQEEDNKIDLGPYGLGTVRTHRDYELYAGINFKNRRLHDRAKRAFDPPTNDKSEWYRLIEKNYNIDISFPAVENMRFMMVAVEDKGGTVLFRQDVHEWVPSITAKFKTTETPYKITCWPMDKNNRWMDRVDTLYKP